MTMSAANAARQTTWGRTNHDDELTPFVGKRVGDIEPARLNQMCRNLGIEGVAASDGHMATAEKYAAAVNRIRDEGGRAAVARWLAENEARA